MIVPVIKIAMRALARNKARSILTMLGIYHRCRFGDRDGESRAGCTEAGAGADLEHGHKSADRIRGKPADRRSPRGYGNQYDADA